MLHQCFASLATGTGARPADLRLTLQDCRLGFNMGAAPALAAQQATAARMQAIAAGEEPPEAPGSFLDPAATAGAAAGAAGAASLAGPGTAAAMDWDASRCTSPTSTLGRRPGTTTTGISAGAGAGLGQSESMVTLAQVSLFLREANLVPRVLAKHITDLYHVGGALAGAAAAVVRVSWWRAVRGPSECLPGSASSTQACCWLGWWLPGQPAAEPLWRLQGGALVPGTCSCSRLPQAPRTNAPTDTLASYTATIVTHLLRHQPGSTRSPR